jgi:hypothetical protein
MRRLWRFLTSSTWDHRFRAREANVRHLGRYGPQRQI